MDTSDIIGRWRILSWVQNYDDGRQVFPMGTSPRGFVTYDPDGGVTIMISDDKRTPFASGAQWTATDEEKARAYDSFMAYCGRYEVLGDVVHHHVELASCPNWQGGVQIRSAALKGGQLSLTARLEDGTPQARTAIILWSKER